MNCSSSCDSFKSSTHATNPKDCYGSSCIPQSLSAKHLHLDTVLYLWSLSTLIIQIQWKQHLYTLFSHVCGRANDFDRNATAILTNAGDYLFRCANNIAC